jgi:hypothetical protein
VVPQDKAGQQTANEEKPQDAPEMIRIRELANQMEGDMAMRIIA